MKSFVLSALVLVTTLFPADESRAATLGLTTEAPSLTAGFSFVDFLEFGPDGDLSSFGSVISDSVGVSPTGFAELGFGIGFSLADPTTGLTGGFDVFDESGLFLSGDVAAVGFTEDVIEIQFGSLTGSAASSFGASVLAVISFFDPLGDNPFAAFSDGTSLFASIEISSVQDTSTPQVPLSGGFVFLATGLVGAFSMRWCI